MYIYLDKEEAKKGISLVITATEEPIVDYTKVLDDNCIEFVGDNIPYYITYVEESNTIREATMIELYNRGLYILSDNEYVKNGEIKTIPLPTKFYVKSEFDTNTETFKEVATQEEFRIALHQTEEKLIEIY
jgi:hypothetical protein